MNNQEYRKSIQVIIATALKEVLEKEGFSSAKAETMSQRYSRAAVRRIPMPQITLVEAEPETEAPRKRPRKAKVPKNGDRSPLSLAEGA